MRFSVNFGCEKILPGNFLEFIGNGIGMPVKSGNKIFKNLGRSKFGRADNSQGMLDQKYLFVTVASSGSPRFIR